MATKSSGPQEVAEVQKLAKQSLAARDSSKRTKNTLNSAWPATPLPFGPITGRKGNSCTAPGSKVAFWTRSVFGMATPQATRFVQSPKGRVWPGASLTLRSFSLSFVRYVLGAVSP